jgi:hypothetical protein
MQGATPVATACNAVTQSEAMSPRAKRNEKMKTGTAFRCSRHMPMRRLRRRRFARGFLDTPLRGGSE